MLTLLALCVVALLTTRANAARTHTTNPHRIICTIFKHCQYAVRIASCETGGTFNPRARGRAGERGWFQIHPVHFGRTLRSSAGRVHVNPDRLYDPAYNTWVAWVLSDGGRNWTPWTCRRYV